MDAMYTCDCADGRTLTGSANCSPNDLKQMTPLQLAAVLSDAKDFARYYSSHFFYPLQTLETEKSKLIHRYESARKTALILGACAAVFTVLWIILAVIPALRFSGITLGLAILTFCSLLLLIPVLFRLISAQQDHAKRYPRLCAKRDRLIQQQEKSIYGTYSDLLISGFLISPEYSLFEEGLDLMIHALNTRKASNLTEATLLCRKKHPHSPVPRLITSLRTISPTEKAEKHPPATPAKSTLTMFENQDPNIRDVMQLAEYLNSAIKRYASTQTVPHIQEATVSGLNYEEESMITEFRALTPDERKRISRVIHSFYTKQY